MAKKASKKSTYPSRYGGGFVSIQQYITECLCENISKKRKFDLPDQFWELEEWNKFFKFQIVILNRDLLPFIHPRAMVKALRDRRCRSVNSFIGFLKVEAWRVVLAEWHFKCIAEDERIAVTTEGADTSAKPRKKLSKKDILTRLRSIK